MKFAILIKSSPYATQSATSAYRFCTAALAAGHTLNTIFFYQDGVYNGNQFAQTASDEFDLIAAWCELAEKNSIELRLCSTAAYRRGILENENLAPHFQISGLGQWVRASTAADRVLVFGD